MPHMARGIPAILRVVHKTVDIHPAITPQIPFSYLKKIAERVLF